MSWQVFLRKCCDVTDLNKSKIWAIFVLVWIHILVLLKLRRDIGKSDIIINLDDCKNLKIHVERGLWCSNSNYSILALGGVPQLLIFHENSNFWNLGNPKASKAKTRANSIRLVEFFPNKISFWLRVSDTNSNFPTDQIPLKTPWSQIDPFQ